MDDQETITTPATHYQSSKGLMLIADMAYPHIANAIAKIGREGRTDQPDVLAALVARRNEMDAAREEAERQ